MRCLTALPACRAGDDRHALLDRSTGVAMRLIDGATRRGHHGQADAYRCVARTLASASPNGVLAGDVARIAAAVRAADGPDAGRRVARILTAR